MARTAKVKLNKKVVPSDDETESVVAAAVVLRHQPVVLKRLLVKKHIAPVAKALGIEADTEAKLVAALGKLK